MTCDSDRSRGQSRRRHGKRAGFTLVELLIVIGIITVLIGILLPTISKARESAKRTKCLSNLRSLAQALIMYSDSSKGKLPNLNPASTVNDPAGTDAVLIALNRDYIRAPGVFHCPSDSDAVPEAIETADYLLPNSARVSYEFYSIWWMPEFGPKLTKVKDAPLAWDLDGGGDTIRHQNHGLEGGNVSFSDGHAEWQRREDWDARNWPHPAEKYYPHAGAGGG